VGYSTLFITTKSFYKKYSFEKSNPLELSRAADGAFVICGFVNPLCRQGVIDTSRTDPPHDPSYNIISLNRCKNHIPSVVVYFPSTGTYYSPRFFADTSRLQLKGLCLCDNGLATKSVLQMLPASALRIKKSDGLPDEGGQLQTFTAVYCVDVCCTKSPILTIYPLLTGNHVPDKNICIPPDIFIGP